MTVKLTEDGLRKCLLMMWPDFRGYGFNLHAEKGKAGQYVGQVDEASPALAAGLKEGDRIVEVNGCNIGNESHQAVVSRIRAGEGKVWLLVVDKATDEQCKNNDIEIKDSLDGVKVIECPPTSPYTNSTPENQDESEQSDVVEADAGDVTNDYESASTAELPPPSTDENIQSESTNHSDEHELENSEELTPPPPPPELSVADEGEKVVTELESQEEVANEPKATDQTVEATETELPKSEPTPEVTEAPKSEPANQNGTSASDDKAVDSMKKMTAAEMREALKQKKKPDPRTQKLSAQDKLAMFQRL